MGDKDAGTPRVFLIRHGATEWSNAGKFTGTTDLPLLPAGVQKIRETASHVFGNGLLIDPKQLLRVYVSPRQRAQQTLKLLLEESGEKVADVRITEDVAEFGYGEYEGMLTHEIRQLRKEHGKDKERAWDIWKDGTEGEGGEAPEDVQRRVDRVIDEIMTLQRPFLKGAKESSAKHDAPRDVLVVAHGHILRAFVKRWVGLELNSDVGIEMMLEPGGVCGLSYAHANVEERALLVGMSFPKS